jgi:MoaA/NifB/PqqE/SkfB family radical SAM enzyme
VGPTGESYRVLQIHPTRRCNLRCLHCYSSSGPEESDSLDPTLLRRALIDASAEGYNVAGFSGGEPLLYRPLRRLLTQARECDMLTTVTTNGLLLDERRLSRLAGVVSLLAISLDGVPQSHNRMRASERAFEGMARRLEGVRRSGIPFGFIFTLTQHNVHELGWVTHFALEQGASLLQIHPLEIVGRAREELSGSAPDEVGSAYAYLAAERVRQIAGDRLRVQLDLVHREVLRAHPGQVFADDVAEHEPPSPLADVLSPLVVEADGTVVPIEHGFARAYALGKLRDAPLCDLAADWRRERADSFRALCREVWTELTIPADLPFVNWYEALGRRAERALAG